MINVRKYKDWNIKKYFIHSKMNTDMTIKNWVWEECFINNKIPLCFSLLKPTKKGKTFLFVLSQNSIYNIVHYANF